MDYAIQLDHVWKRYVLGEGSSALDVLRRRPRREQWALRDLDLAVRPGESLGLIGHNGAGKTTALKLIAGISRPSRGSVSVHGRIASLINLGAGFHRELSGHDNVLLNGVLLGLSRQQVRQRYDQIVAFSGLDPAVLAAPVKQYSTGMYARLGFAVAAHADPRVLLVDEVLSVGDATFQDRSMRRMLAFRDSGTAVVFVSHNLSAVEMMCERAVWLEQGQVVQVGPTADVVRAYLDAVDQHIISESSAEQRALGMTDGVAEIKDFSIRDAADRLTADLHHGQPWKARFVVANRVALRDVRVEVSVRGDYSQLFRASSAEDGQRIPVLEAGTWTLGCAFDDLPVLPGLYRADVSITHADNSQPVYASTAFRVTNDLADFGGGGIVGATKSRGGFLAVPYAWRIETSADTYALPGLKRPEA